MEKIFFWIDDWSVVWSALELMWKGMFAVLFVLSLIAIIVWIMGKLEMRAEKTKMNKVPKTKE